MRLRVLTVLSVMALFVGGAVPASAASEGHGYLALGDSVPFGFNPLANPTDAGNFIGYPEIAAQRLNIEDVNATCPGEASGGFLSLTGTDNVCRPYRSFFPLHTGYTGTQMAFATSYLSSHPDTRLVTLTLGANDLFRWQKDCAVSPTTGTCPLGFGGVLVTMRANLNTILACRRGGRPRAERPDAGGGGGTRCCHRGRLRSLGSGGGDGGRRLVRCRPADSTHAPALLVVRRPPDPARSRPARDGGRERGCRELPGQQSDRLSEQEPRLVEVWSRPGPPCGPGLVH
jgi:hypothetical protein